MSDRKNALIAEPANFGQYEQINASGVELSDELRATVSVHLKVEVGHDLELHLGGLYRNVIHGLLSPTRFATPK